MLGWNDITRDTHAGLHHKALRDLTFRARTGIPLYLTVWLIMAFWQDLPVRIPAFFYGNALILLLVALARSWHWLIVAGSEESSTAETLGLTRALEVLLLITALHWGAMSAWLVHHPDFGSLRLVVTVVLAAFAMGGTPILSISPIVRFLYPLLVFLPSAVGALIIGGSENLILVALLFFSLIYIYLASQVVARDYADAVVSQKLAEERACALSEMSTTDALTRLRNRKFFDDRLAEDWRSCQRHGLPVCVFMIDLDHFKQINDTYGHPFGDLCLQRAADVLRARLQRSTDTVARYGGEEFVVLLPGTAGADTLALAQDIVRSVAAATVEHDSGPVRLTCSIGVAALVPDTGNRKETLLEQADKALYEAKAAGRNRVVLYRDAAGPQLASAVAVPGTRGSAST